MYTMVYWTLRGYVCTSWVVLWRGINVSLVVVVGASASALRDRRVCVTNMHDIKSIRMFEDDVTWPEHVFVIQGDSLGRVLGWWSDVCNLKNGCLLWAA